MKKNKKVLLYSPYLDTFGGGERHYLSIIKALGEKGYKTDILWDNPLILRDIETHLQMRLVNAQCVPNFLKKNNVISKIMRTLSYDVVLYVTDGSYFLSLGKKNYIFAMVPQRSLYQMTIINKIKTFNQQFIANSKFTQSYLKKWSIQSEILYPYIDDDYFTDYSLQKKEPIILSVGRFFSYLHSKKQEEIISSFIKIKQKNKLFEKYELYLVGRVKDDDKKYFNKIQQMVKNRNDIHLLTNMKQDKLIDLYKKSDLYWHFTGYGEDKKNNPQSMEHLGIAPLEAMAAGCVVFAFNGGGIGEIIVDEKTGYLFNNHRELSLKIDRFMRVSDMISLRRHAQDVVKNQFSYDQFTARVVEIFNV